MVKIERLAEYDNNKGLSMQDAILEANKKGLRILTNKEIDERLITDTWKQEKEVYPCWTGTLIAYQKPNTKLGKTIEYEGLTINIPKKFQNVKNKAIVCNHPDFILNKNIITLGKTAKLISLPKEDGWYSQDKNYGIPTGKQKEKSDANRYLWVWETSHYVGLVRRYYDGFGVYWRDVVVVFGPYYRFGVLGTKSKNKTIKHKHEWTCKICGKTKR